MFQSVPLMIRLALAASLFAAGANAVQVTPGDDTKKKMKKGPVAEKMAPADFEKLQKKVAIVLDKMIAQQGPDAVCDGKCENEAKCAQYLTWAQENPTAYWAEKLGAKKETIKAVAPQVVDRFAAKGTGKKEQAILLDFVSHVPALHGADYVGKLWEIQPAAFSENHLLALTSKEVKGMVKELAHRAEKYNQDPDTMNLGPALWFAFHGDARGEATLKRAWKQAEFANCVALPSLSALGLESLGHEGVLKKTQALTQDAVVAALDEGRTDDARTMALQAEYLAKILTKTKGLKKAKGLQVAWLQEGMRDHCMARAKEVASAKAIFELIEKVSPTM